MATPPTIDATLNEDEWKEASRFEGLQDSNDGSVAPETGTFWIGYDDENVYFAARLVDEQPSTISANEYRTNVDLGSDDHVVFSIDPVGNDRDWHWFRMNPNGATDLDLPGGTAAKREWSGEFVAKGRVIETGWEVEAKIPWRILRLPPPGPRQVNFNFGRFHRRLGRFYTWSYTPTGKVGYHGRWTNVEIPASETDRTLKLLPYGYVGGAEGEGLILNGGLDMKMGLSRDVQFVGTINPDFRNIENQVLSLDFSRFERLAGESRPFFQEGSHYLSTILFASQRIRKVDAGANVFGRLDSRTTFGVLNTVHLREDEEHALASNFSFSTSARSSAGLAFTHLDRFDVNNEAYLLRYSQSMGPYFVFGRYSETNDSERGKGLEWSGNFNYWNEGIGWGFNYRAVSPDFMPRLGFAPETDFKGYSAYFNYYKQYQGGAFNDGNIFASVGDFDRFDGGEYRSSASLSGGLSHRSGISASASAFEAEFLGQKDRLYSLNFSYPHTNSYRNMFVGISKGKFAGEDYSDLSFGGRYRFNDRLSASLSSQFVKHFENQQQQILSLNYDFRDDRTLGGRIVRFDDNVNWYLSYRRAGARGMEYYLILGDPNAQRFRESLVLKVVYPLDVILGR